MPSILRAKGLYTFPNELSSIPEGALLQADNVIIDRDSIIESRRGFNIYGTDLTLSADRAEQLFSYKRRILRHFDDTLQFDSDANGDFESFDGTYIPTETGLRIKGVEANGNFYFTTLDGIKKISAKNASEFTNASDYIVGAGGPKALDLEAVVNYQTSGFLFAESKVAYRIVWGITDVNSNVILGAPSSRTIVTNISTTLDAIVDLTFPIPFDVINTNYYYQVYRTATAEKGALPSLDDVEPGDEMNLVFEANVTEAQLTAGEVTLTDITPEDFRIGGTPLYTNPVTGDGILQSNDKPPFSKDLALFQNSLFFANTQTLHRLTFNILGLSDFNSGSSQFIVSDGDVTRIYTFVGEVEVTDITADAKASTAASSYILINSANNQRKYYFWFDTTGTDTEPSAMDTEGRLGVRVDISADTTDTDVATTLSSVIDGLDDFSSTVLGAVVTITWAENGNVDDAVFGATAPGGVWAISVTTQGDGEEPDTAEGGDVLLSSLASPAQAVDETARSLVKIINRDSNGIINAYYLSGPGDLPGNILLEARHIDSDKFYLALNETTLVDKFNPSIPVTVIATAVSAANPTEITSVAHGLADGTSIIIYDSDSTPVIDGLFSITVIDVDTFSIPVDVTIVGTTATYFTASTFSDNEGRGNRVFYSKVSQPDAVPLVNFFDVGPKDKAIKRILALRESLFVLKEDGIYRVVGEIGSFSVNLMDSSAIILAADSAAILNNQIYVLTSQGVTSVTDTGIGIISRSIEDKIREVANENFIDYSTISFGIASEIDRAYFLWLPTSTSDDVATQCFRYNVFTQTWTRWTVSGTSGVINLNIIYLGAGDTNHVLKERKNFALSDFSDREFNVQVLLNTVHTNTLIIAPITNAEVGDVLSQEQYLTIAQFNRLLKRLDIDPSVSFNDYYSTLFASAGNDLSLHVSDLAIKLDADPGVDQTTFSSSISGATTFVGIQSDFNIIINLLNNDSSVFYVDYDESNGTVTYQIPIVDVNRISGQLTLLNTLPYISGPALILKSIGKVIEWAPYHAGAPESFKQINQATVLFHSNTFSNAHLAYKTDLSPGFEEIDFAKYGTGRWGFFNWGTIHWGGGSNASPFRTLIPRNKQRCRYINCRFRHNIALENVAIIGISYNPRIMSERSYR